MRAERPFSATPLVALPILVLLVLALGAAPAAGQQEREAGPVDEIVVTAPRITERARLPAGRGVRVSMSYYVRYDDLDLSEESDRYEVEGRIMRAASEICGLLAELYPDGEPGAAVCTQRAVRDAMARLQEAIDAA